MFGIPTRSDVKDETYQRAVRIETLENTILKGRWPSNPEALRRHCEKTNAGYLYMNRQARGKLLGAQELLDQYLTNIVACRETLDMADREGLLQTEQTEVQTGKELLFTEPDTRGWLQRKIDGYRGRPAPGIDDSAFFKKREVGPRHSPFHDVGSYMQWGYSFNPKEIAYRELELFERAMRDAYANSADDTERLIEMLIVAKKFDNREAKQFMDMTIFPHVGWPWAMEYDEGTQAYLVRKEHDRIAKESDIYLNFDESNFVIAAGKNGHHYISTKDVLKPKLTSDGLFSRTFLRDSIESALERKSCVVFNGTRYQRGDAECYITDGEVPAGMAGIFGAPVQTSQGRIEPQIALARERELVQQYRADFSTTDVLLAAYSGFGLKEGTSDLHTAKHKLAVELENHFRPDHRTGMHGNWD